MKKLSWLCVLLGTLCLLTACRSTPTVTIDGGTTTQAVPTEPTVPVPDGNMSIEALMARMGTTMTWSSLAEYTHTDVDAANAVFPVYDARGNSCTLSVTYDAASDTVQEATLTYADTTVSVMTDDTMALRTIMLAMNEE